MTKKVQLSMLTIRLLCLRAVGHLMILSIALSSVYECKSLVGKDPLDQLQSVRLFYNWEIVFLETGQLVRVSDSVLVHYWEDLVLYQIPILHQNSVLADSGDDTLTETIIKSTIKYKYFAFRQGTKTGISYNTLKDKAGVRFSVDSLLLLKSFQNLKAYDRENDSLIYFANSEEDFTYIEKYIPKIKYDDTYADSTYLYFSEKLNNIRYSFSAELDSITLKKLFKVIFVYNEIPEGKYKFRLPRRELLFAIDKVNASDSSEIIKLFDTFRNNAKNLF